MDLVLLVIAFLSGVGIGGRVSYEILKDKKTGSAQSGGSDRHAA